jgi:hypothetical protein
MYEALTSSAHQSVDALASAAEQTVVANNATIATLNGELAASQAKVTSDEQTIAALQAQLAAVPKAVKVYDHIESTPFGQNSLAQVGGSGLGVATQKQPGVECAEFAIAPTPPAVGASNYFDCYYYQDFPLDDSLTKFKLEASWLFPTLADANASQCLEMEARHVLTNGNMYVIACQLDFADKALRVFDHTKKWFPIGVAQPRLVPETWYTVTLEGHHDATTIYYDGVTINGVKSVPVGQGAVFNLGWKRMNRIALQLDGNGHGTPYRVKLDNVRLTVS